jgi:hypothetical protein
LEAQKLEELDMCKLLFRAYLCLAITGLLGTANSEANFLTFDDLSLNNMDAITTQYASQGVIFQGVTDAGTSVSVDVYDGSFAGGDYPVSPPLELSNFYGSNFGNRAHIVKFIFTGGANGINFYFNPQGSAGPNTAFNIYDMNHNLVHTYPGVGIGDAWVLLNFPDSNVGEMDMVNPQPGWALLVDNLSFTPVPEPSVAAIGSFLWLSFALVRNRRKAG